MLITDTPGIILQPTTGTANDILSPKTAYLGTGEYVTGTITEYDGTVTFPTTSTLQSNAAEDFAIKVIVNYNNNNIVQDYYVEGTNTLTISYGDSTLAVMGDKEDMTLKTSGTCANCDIMCGSIRLNTTNKLLSTDIVIYTYVYSKLKPVYGKIFYLADWTNKKSKYIFYDGSGQEITTKEKVADLINAKFYRTEGTILLSDNIYAVDPDTFLKGTWGKYQIDMSAMNGTSIGQGKSNTAIMLSKTLLGTLWTKLRTYNNDHPETGDWFIGSQYEINTLRLSGKVDLSAITDSVVFTSSAIENNDENAYAYKFLSNDWTISRSISRNTSGYSFPIRSF